MPSRVVRHYPGSQGRYGILAGIISFNIRASYPIDCVVSAYGQIYGACASQTSPFVQHTHTRFLQLSRPFKQRRCAADFRQARALFGRHGAAPASAAAASDSPGRRTTLPSTPDLPPVRHVRRGKAPCGALPSAPDLPPVRHVQRGKAPRGALPSAPDLPPVRHVQRGKPPRGALPSAPDLPPVRHIQREKRAFR
eukprot:1177063-Prorocentrum_minimum.AAC.2